tara:strand:+ start:20722 stop:28095 length:7374 start_codon:yes stop_codon:yes gene_type:complete
MRHNNKNSSNKTYKKRNNVSRPRISKRKTGKNRKKLLVGGDDTQTESYGDNPDNANIFGLTARSGPAALASPYAMTKGMAYKWNDFIGPTKVQYRASARDARIREKVAAPCLFFDLRAMSDTNNPRRPGKGSELYLFDEEFLNKVDQQSLFDSKDRKHSCLRTLIHLKLFVVNDKELFEQMIDDLESAKKIIRMRLEVDGRADKFDELYKLLEQTVEEHTYNSLFKFIKDNLGTTHARSFLYGRDTRLVDLIGRLKPTFYLRIITDNRLSFLQRKLIYQIMNARTKCTTPEKFRNIYYNFNYYYQLNYGVGMDHLKPLINEHIKPYFENNEILPFPTNNWDTHMQYKSRKIKDVANWLNSIRDSLNDVNDPQILNNENLTILLGNAYVESWTRPGGNYMFLAGGDPDEDNEKSGQTVFYRYSNVPVLDPLSRKLLDYDHDITPADKFITQFIGSDPRGHTIKSLPMYLFHEFLVMLTMSEGESEEKSKSFAQESSKMPTFVSESLNGKYNKPGDSLWEDNRKGNERSFKKSEEAKQDITSEDMKSEDSSIKEVNPEDSSSEEGLPENISIVSSSSDDSDYGRLGGQEASALKSEKNKPKKPKRSVGFQDVVNIEGEERVIPSDVKFIAPETREIISENEFFLRKDLKNCAESISQVKAKIESLEEDIQLLTATSTPPSKNTPEQTQLIDELTKPDPLTKEFREDMKTDEEKEEEANRENDQDTLAELNRELDEYKAELEFLKKECKEIDDLVENSPPLPEISSPMNKGVPERNRVLPAHVTMIKDLFAQTNFQFSNQEQGVQKTKQEIMVDYFLEMEAFYKPRSDNAAKKILEGDDFTKMFLILRAMSIKTPSFNMGWIGMTGGISMSDPSIFNLSSSQAWITYGTLSNFVPIYDYEDITNPKKKLNIWSMPADQQDQLFPNNTSGADVLWNHIYNMESKAVENNPNVTQMTKQEYIELSATETSRSNQNSAAKAVSVGQLASTDSTMTPILSIPRNERIEHFSFKSPQDVKDKSTIIESKSPDDTLSLDNTHFSPTGIDYASAQSSAGMIPFGLELTEQQYSEVMNFLNYKTKGLIKSDAVKDYNIKHSLNVGTNIILANRQKGYIYSIVANYIHYTSAGNKVDAGTRLPLGITVAIYSIHNTNVGIDDADIEIDDITLWMTPTKEQQYQMKLLHPRLYYGWFKHMWEDLEKGVKDDSAIPYKHGEVSLTKDDSIENPLDIPGSTVPPPIQVDAERYDTASGSQLQNALSTADLGVSSSSVDGDDGDDGKDEKDGNATGAFGIFGRLGGEDEDKDVLRPDFPVPDTVSVTVRTTVPNYTTVIFEPSMVNKEANNDKSYRNKDRVIRLDPLVPLTKKSIDKTPEDYDLRKRQFSDRMAFETLVARAATETLFGVKKLSFEDAIQKNVVENNIRLTLDTIFKPGTVIYLGGNPYNIYSADFSETNWKLGPKDRVDADLTMANVLDAGVLSIQDRQGTKELQEMPDELKRGAGNDSYIPPRERQRGGPGGDFKGTVATSDSGSKIDGKDKDTKKKPDTSTSAGEEILKPADNTVNAAGDEPVDGDGSNEQGEKLVNPYGPISPLPDPESAVGNPSNTAATGINVFDKTIPPPPRTGNNPARKKPMEVSNVSDVPVANTDPFVQPAAVTNSLIQDMRNFFIYGPLYQYTPITDDDLEGRPITRLGPGGLAPGLTQEQKDTLKVSADYFNLMNYLNKVSKSVYEEDGTRFRDGIYENVFKLGKNMVTGQGKEFTVDNYKNEQVKQLQLIEIPGDGDCFYNCMATAFNMHNAYLKISPQNVESTPEDAVDTGEIKYDETDVLTGKRIIRGGTEFNSKFMRWAVVNYFRANKSEIVQGIIISNFYVYGYNATSKWAQETFPEYVTSSQNIIDLMGYFKTESEALYSYNGSDSRLDIFRRELLSEKQKLQEKNKTFTDQDRFRIIENLRRPFWDEVSNNAMFVSLNNIEKDTPLNEIEPFKVARSIEEAEVMLMDKNYYAKQHTVIIMEKIFNTKVINIEKSDEEDIEPGVDNTMHLKRVRKFRTNNYMKLYDTEQKYDRIVFLSYENYIHYNLLVFANPLSAAIKKERMGGSNNYKTRRMKSVKDMFKKRKTYKKGKTGMSGGANMRKNTQVTPENRKKVVFFKNPMNIKKQGPSSLANIEESFRRDKNTDSDSKSETQTSKVPQLDDLTTSFPVYIYMLLYSQYNSVPLSERKDPYEIFNSYILYYLEFSIIDTLINGLAKSQEDLRQFSVLYKRIFSLDSRPVNLNTDYFPAMQNMIIQLSDTDSEGSAGSKLRIANEPFVHNIDVSDGDKKEYMNALTTRKIIDLTEGDDEDDNTTLTEARVGGQLASSSDSYSARNIYTSYPYGSINKDVLDIMNKKKSNLSFHVTVDLILKEGSEKTGFLDSVGLGCESRGQKIRRNWSAITGREYRPTPRKFKLPTGKSSKEEEKKEKDEKDEKDDK